MNRSKSTIDIFDFCGLNFSKLFTFGQLMPTEKQLVDQSVKSSHYA